MICGKKKDIAQEPASPQHVRQEKQLVGFAVEMTAQRLSTAFEKQPVLPRNNDGGGVNEADPDHLV